MATINVCDAPTHGKAAYTKAYATIEMVDTTTGLHKIRKTDYCHDCFLKRLDSMALGEIVSGREYTIKLHL